MSPFGLRVPVENQLNDPKGRPMKKLVRPVRKVNAHVLVHFFKWLGKYPDNLLLFLFEFRLHKMRDRKKGDEREN